MKFNVDAPETSAEVNVPYAVVSHQVFQAEGISQPESPVVRSSNQKRKREQDQEVQFVLVSRRQAYLVPHTHAAAHTLGRCEPSDMAGCRSSLPTSVRHVPRTRFNLSSI